MGFRIVHRGLTRQKERIIEEFFYPNRDSRWNREFENRYERFENRDERFENRDKGFENRSDRFENRADRFENRSDRFVKRELQESRIQTRG